ncbi:TetR/AcrR family transcriptional regulator [Vulgatibacter sp.]|uniref:TetR/AcrR family transcriptional regulator n=1 Tax=Vulgatibacter sp. TaxID=1971226 RepID=UPI00356AD070
MARGVGKVKNAYEEMMKEGRRLLRVGGPAAVSLRNIARGLGCSAGVFYNYICNVEDVRQHVAREVLGELRASLRVAARPGAGAFRLVAQARAYRSFWRMEPGSFAFTFRHDSPYPVAKQEELVGWFWPDLARLGTEQEGVAWYTRVHGLMHLEISRVLEPAMAEALWQDLCGGLAAAARHQAPEPGAPQAA